MTLTSNPATSRQSSWSGTIPRLSNINGLCLIIDHDLLRVGPADAMRQALAAGVRFFQYRSKSGTRKNVYEESLRLAGIARESGALFIVNDHADIAAAVDADGVHLGQDDLPFEHARTLLGRNKIIGISTHSPEQAIAAEAMGADYIGFGPLFKSSTKDAGQTQGLGNLTIVRNAVSIPIIAIGGINQANARFVAETGADGVAVIGAILLSDNITSASGQIIQLLKEVRRER